jgi:hypothetical protein
MSKLVALCVAASFSLFPILGTAQGLVEGCTAAGTNSDGGAILVVSATDGPMPLSFGPQEAVELLIGIRGKPGSAASRDTVIEWAVTLRGPDGNVIGSSTQEVAMAGLVRFEISTEDTDVSSDGGTQVLVNDEPIGFASLIGGRIVLQLDVCRQREGRNPQTGQPIQIAAKNVMKFARLTTFNLSTGETQAIGDGKIGDGKVFVLPIDKAIRNPTE